MRNIPGKNLNETKGIHKNMNVIYSTAGIISSTRPGQGVMDMAAAGFEHVLLDLPMFCSSWELENFGKKQKKMGVITSPESVSKPFVSQNPSQLYEDMKLMLDQYKKANLSTPIARAPHLPRDTKREDLTPLLIKLIQESIKICGKTGCEYIIVKPLTFLAKQSDVKISDTEPLAPKSSAPKSSDTNLSDAEPFDSEPFDVHSPAVLSSITEAEDEWQTNRNFYLTLASTARQQNVTILLENQCRDINGHLVRGLCSDPDEACAWVDKLNQEAGEERFGFCVDAGSCNLCGQNMQEFITSMGSRIKAVILRDCDGQKESSMLPFTCSGFGQTNTDWLGLIRGLRSVSFDGQLILDFATTACSFSPLLRPQLLQLAKAVGEYFKWQIEMEHLLKKHGSIVLFGAGNMCRNYMKCYGRDYPPLFTCDNNPKLWGTFFCGLEVKPPESLKQLPKDCVIFICNIYYREIERQLRDMGIQNHIQFFNDEYMPSFYFDRLERGE